VDKFLQTVDWTTAEQFGFEDNFVTQVIANLTAPSDGSYVFRLTSDDGSKLYIDDKIVIDHDGLHGAERKDGTVELTAGLHAPRVEHFERTGGQQLTLAWQPPDASSFTLVPNTVLSTDAGVVRVTSPGRKECAAGTDTPGDGLPLAAVNPGYTLTNLRPEGFQPQVTGMAWRPDGKQVDQPARTRSTACSAWPVCSAWMGTVGIPDARRARS
jgi:PA14 domain